MTSLEIIFWIFIFMVFYTYLGYGILIAVLVKIKEAVRKPKRPEPPDKEALPRVTLLIAAYNEEEIIDEKMVNNYALDYPAELFDIAWVTDGSNDGTNKKIEPYTIPAEGKPKVTLFFEAARGGKTAAINRVMPMISTPIVAFTDANTMLNTSAIMEMVCEFANSKVGCVAGEKRVVVQTKDGAASSEGIYWKYESFLKSMDWRLHTAVGAAGELYAIRRELFEMMPTDTLLDDFMLSMRIAQKGYRIAYCPSAFAEEGGSLNMKEEEKRKVRIAAGGLQSIARLLPLLNPFKYGVLHFQYVSHRVLRWSITPVLLFSLLPINVFLILSTPSMGVFYAIILVFQVLFYLAAIAGLYLANHQIRNKILYIPYYFLFMNVNVFRGACYLCKRNGKNGAWEKAKRK